MTKLTYKEQITQTVLEQLNDDLISFEHAMKTWWQNPRRDSAMRLTQIDNDDDSEDPSGIDYLSYEEINIINQSSYSGYVSTEDQDIKYVGSFKHFVPQVFRVHIQHEGIKTQSDTDTDDIKLQPVSKGPHQETR